MHKKILNIFIFSLIIISMVGCNNKSEETTFKVVFLDESKELLAERKVIENQTILDFPIYEKEGQIFIGWVDESQNEINEETKITKNLILMPIVIKKITELYFEINKTSYQIIKSPPNISYTFEYKSYNYNYLKITSNDGYVFIEDIIIIVKYSDGTSAKFIGQTIEENYIEYIIDDPNWTGIY